MTKRELVEALKDVPDDAIVFVIGDDHGPVLADLPRIGHWYVEPGLGRPYQNFSHSITGAAGPAIAIPTKF
jgi:hypothetical protein